MGYTKQMHITGVNYRIGYLADTLCVKIKIAYVYYPFIQ